MICVIPSGDCPPDYDEIKLGRDFFLYPLEGKYAYEINGEKVMYPITTRLIEDCDLWQYFTDDDFDENGEYIAP